MNMRKSKNTKLGETRINNQGEKMFIDEYNSSSDIKVQFVSTGEVVRTTYGAFKSGSVKSHFTPSVYGVGIVGLENIHDENGKFLKSYRCWVDMLRRTCSKSFKEQYKYGYCYDGVTVCDEWLYYPNFKKFYDNNYYEIEGFRTQLDKDILVKGNKIYSPETCAFVPNVVNNILTYNRTKDNGLPSGVTLTLNKKYKVSMSTYNYDTNKTEHKFYGTYDTTEEAYEVYKQAKESNLQRTAEHFKDVLPANVYTALINYQI